MKLDLYLTPHTKIYSKWIKDLNLSAKSIKLSEENIGIHLHDLVLGNSFLDMIRKGLATKGKIDNLDFTKLKTFFIKGHY